MKNFFIFASAVALLFAGCKTSNNVNAKVESLANSTDSMSYALGVSISQNLKDQGVTELNYSVLAQAMEEQFNEEALMDPMAADELIRTSLMAIRDAKDQEAKKAGLEWLEQNQSNPGVVTTASGLQYKIITEGTGASPVASDEVTVHYEGRLIDGTIFDSSYERGEPATFPLGNVIPGWTEGLQYLKVGGKAELYIPSDLGYGSRQAPGGAIPAFSTLIFVVELIDIKN
jgi:FKBP-type peptidyl-prolyl cis-trans isomerase